MASSSNTVEILSEGTVESWSRHNQMLHGDSAIFNSRITSADSIEIDCSKNNLRGLKAIVDRLPDEARRSLTIQYGWIIHLLFAPALPTLTRSLINFWDPSYKCFSFGKYDLTPTLEEYHQLLNIPLRDENRLYVHNKDERPWRQLARMLGKKTSDLDSWRTGYDFDTSIMLEFANDNIDNDNGLKMLALLIYGLLLFPKRKGKIDSKVIIFFTKVAQRGTQGINPVIGILAETFRSLDKCRTSGGRFEGCMQLLCIWALSHLNCPKSFNFPELKFNKSYNPAKNYINDFVQANWPEEGPRKRNWERFLGRIEENDIRWLAGWNSQVETIFKCGSNLLVPLLGLWGGVGYAPLMVRRQFGARQFIPLTANLEGSSFSYEESKMKDKIPNTLKAWGQVRKVVRTNVNITASDSYLEWVNCRLRRFVAPERIRETLEMMFPVQSDKDIEIDRLRKRVLELEASNQEIREDRDSIAEDNQYYLNTMSVKVQEYDDEIRSLREQNYFYQREKGDDRRTNR